MNSINRVNGMKVVKKWNLGLFISCFLMLGACGGLIAAMYFLPLFGADFQTSLNGNLTNHNYLIYTTDFVYFVLQNFLGTNSISNGFWTFNSSAICTLIPQNLEIIRYILIDFIFGLIAILVLFALISVITFVFGLLFGVIKGGWGAPKVLTWLSFSFTFVLALVFVTLKLLLMFLVNGAPYGSSGSTIASYNLNIWYLVGYCGVLLVLGIIQSIIYNVCFKDRIYIKDAKRILEAQKQKQEMMSQQMGYGYAMPMPMMVPAPNYQMNNVPQMINNQPVRPTSNPTIVTQVKYSPGKGLPEQLSSIGGHAFSQNSNLEIAIIPLGIKEIGPSAFSNCPNLKVVSIPTSVTKIGYNAFFGCKKLARINYGGRKNEWKNIVRGSNWLASSGTSVVVCVDGAITVNPYH